MVLWDASKMSEKHNMSSKPAIRKKKIKNKDSLPWMVRTWKPLISRADPGRTMHSEKRIHQKVSIFDEMAPVFEPKMPKNRQFLRNLTIYFEFFRLLIAQISKPFTERETAWRKVHWGKRFHRKIWILTKWLSNAQKWAFLRVP